MGFSITASPSSARPVCSTGTDSFVQRHEKTSIFEIFFSRVPPDAMPRSDAPGILRRAFARGGRLPHCSQSRARVILTPWNGRHRACHGLAAGRHGYRFAAPYGRYRPRCGSCGTALSGRGSTGKVFADALGWLESQRELSFDLTFADTMPGKFERFEAVWERLKPGGLCVTDDMLPQKNWPDGHGERVAGLLVRLERRPECILVEMAWSSGLAIAAKSAYRPRGPHRQ